MTSPELSIIIPVYNGAKSIEKLVEALYTSLEKIEFELILVNDYSVDNTEDICIKISEQRKNVTFISLRKNCGEFAAVFCGLKHASGAYSVIIDDDFQHTPSEILKLLTEIKNKKLDVVYAKFMEKKHSIFRNLGSYVSNKLANTLIGKPDAIYLSSFKIIEGDFVKEITSLDVQYPYIDGIIFRNTQSIGSIEIIHQNRLDGNSNYTISKLISYFLTTIFSQSTFPLKFLGIVGLLIFPISIIAYFLGWSPIVSVLLLCLSFQLIGLYILGEYLGNIYFTTQKQTPYSIKSILKS